MSPKKLTFALLLGAAALAACAYLHAAPPPAPPCFHHTTATAAPTALLPSGEEGMPTSSIQSSAFDVRRSPAETVEAPRPVSAFTKLVALVFGGGALLGAIRRIQDVRDNRTLAIPAAGATGDSDSIFIGTGPHVEDLEVQVVIPALPDLVDAKTVIVTLQDSADDSSFAAIAGLDTLTALGAGGIGFAGVTREVRLPSSFRGYLRMHLATLAAAGDNTAVEIQLNLLQ